MGKIVRVIRSITDLNDVGCLSLGDKIYFGDLKYAVRSSFLDCSSGDNFRIFELLGILDTKYKVASQAYGYTTTRGDFPYFKERDYEAATRLVKLLYKRLQMSGKKLIMSFDLCQVEGKSDFYTIDLHTSNVNFDVESVVLVHKNGNHWILNEKLYKENEKFLPEIIKAIKDGIFK